MSSNSKSAIPAILKKHNNELVAEWQQEQAATSSNRNMNEGELRQQCLSFISSLDKATQSGDLEDITSTAWADVRDFLSSISRSRAMQGMSAAETATFVFSFKKPLFSLM